MGRREHAGHVFAKVCASNTKAARQTGSIPRASQEEDARTAVLRAAISRVSFGWPPGRFAFLSSFLSAYHRRRGRTTPYVVKEGIAARRPLNGPGRGEGSSFPFMRRRGRAVLRNVIAYYVRDRLCIGYIMAEAILVGFRLPRTGFCVIQV